MNRAVTRVGLSGTGFIAKGVFNLIRHSEDFRALEDDIRMPDQLGVVIVATNPVADLTPGYTPFSRLRTTRAKAYVLVRDYHLCYLEVLQTLRRIRDGEKLLLTNSAEPRYTVAAAAKRFIASGSVIERGVGSFDTRGLGVPSASNRDAVPICLLKNTPVVRDIEPGETIRYQHVDLAESRASSIYSAIVAERRRPFRITADGTACAS